MTADELIGKLSDIAEEYGVDEYGLPMGDQTSRIAMREAVAAFAADVSRRERYACAKIVEGWSWPGYDAGSEILGEIAEAIRGQS